MTLMKSLHVFFAKSLIDVILVASANLLVDLQGAINCLSEIIKSPTPHDRSTVVNRFGILRSVPPIWANSVLFESS